MAYTTPPTFTAGTVLTAANLNILGDDIVYLKGITDGVNFSGVQLRRTATQSITTATWTAVTWQTETGGFDNGGWWSSGTNIVVPAGAIPSGFTTIACDVLARTYFGTNGTGSRKIRILVDGSVTETGNLPAISGDQTDVWVPDAVVVAAGAIITVEVYQNSGSTLSIASSDTKVTVLRRAPVA